MSDVFLSYKAEDRPRLRQLVVALEADGLSLWWDAQIEGGATWRQSIQEQLDAARCVVVVWSKRSVGPEGRFVHDEATRAQHRGVYLPILIDPVMIAKARMQDRAGSDQALAQFKAIDDGSLSYQFAEMYAQRGEPDLAIEALELAYRSADPGLGLLRGDPFVDPIRADPRFKALVARLGFPA